MSYSTNCASYAKEAERASGQIVRSVELALNNAADINSRLLAILNRLRTPGPTPVASVADSGPQPPRALQHSAELTEKAQIHTFELLCEIDSLV